MKTLIQKMILALARPAAVAWNDSAAGARSDGAKSYLPGEAIADVNLFVTLSSGKVVKASENGFALGQNKSPVEAADVTTGLPVAVELLGAAPGTKTVVAEADIAALAEIVVGAAAKAKTLPTDNGTYYVVGIATHAVVAGGNLEYIPVVPRKVVISN